MQVVIIDDEPLAIERMKFLLSRFDQIQIEGEYTCAKDALEEIPGLKPDLIFCDVEMNGLSGIEFIQKLNELHFPGHVVFVTAHDHYMLKALREQAFDYLLKPVDIDELKACIERFQVKNHNRFQQLDKIKEEYQLSDREIEVLICMLKGQSSHQIAKTLYISIHTANTHRRNILAKMGIDSSRELIARFSSWN